LHDDPRANRRTVTIRQRYRRAAVALPCLIAGLLLPAGFAGARAPVLFATTDQNPFIQIHHLPWPAESARPAAGEWSLGWTLDMSNSSISEEGGAGERVVIDGETWRGTLAIAYGLSARFEAGLVVPLVSHQTGIFDGFIRKWHDIYGMSNSRRDQFDDYALEYAFHAMDETRVLVDTASSGIGDIRLSGAWRLRSDGVDQRALTVRAGVKLPTGSATRLHGSGGTDLSLQLLSTDAMTLSTWGTTLSWMVGALRLGRGDVLDELRRDHVAIGSIGIARPLWRNLLLKLQVDAHGSFYDTDIDIIGANSAQLVFGGGIRLKQGGMIDIGMVQNLSTNTTPDFGIHFAWHTRL
jgi:hypothetical protein